MWLGWAWIRTRTLGEACTGLPRACEAPVAQDGTDAESERWKAAVLVAAGRLIADGSTAEAATVAAIATRLGGPTSHTAIIARQLGIPCVVAAPDLADITEGALVLIDGESGPAGRGADRGAACWRVPSRCDRPSLHHGSRS